MGWYPATVKTAATAEPVSVAAARRQCGISGSDSSQDPQLEMLIAAARLHVEKRCSIRLPKQTITAPCDSFSDFARVPHAPVGKVVAVSYSDSDGANQTLDEAVYEPRLDGLQPTITLGFRRAWPSIRPGSRVIVEMEVGFDPVPKDIEAALLLIVQSNFVFTRADLLKRSETVEGVGSTQWSGGVEISRTMEQRISSLLEPYTCWPLA